MLISARMGHLNPQKTNMSDPVAIMHRALKIETPRALRCKAAPL
jgi:hypothetical protein